MAFSETYPDKLNSVGDFLSPLSTLYPSSKVPSTVLETFSIGDKTGKGQKRM